MPARFAAISQVSCGHDTDILADWKVMEDEEVEEIMDEEREIVEALELEMQEIEKALGTDLDQALLTAIFQLSLKLKMLSQGNGTSFGCSVSPPSFHKKERRNNH
jgi:predicted DNA-binding ArsR family transcriptional regulator